MIVKAIQRQRERGHEQEEEGGSKDGLGDLDGVEVEVAERH